MKTGIFLISIAKIVENNQTTKRERKFFMIFCAVYNRFTFSSSRFKKIIHLILYKKMSICHIVFPYNLPICHIILNKYDINDIIGNNIEWHEICFP